MDKSTALLIIDVQNDFCPGGALPVRNGDKIIAPLNLLIEKFRKLKLKIIATRDWHPYNHCSFTENGGIWPSHCVQKTVGADFSPDLNIDLSEDIIIPKGENRDKDEYSGFENEKLHEFLKMASIKTLVTGGLATDYCVKATVLDGLKRGYRVNVVEECIKGVEVSPGDIKNAINIMKKEGALFFDYTVEINLLGL